MTNTKIDMVLDFMRTHEGITQMDAYKLCYATRLAAIIALLKNRGYVIDTVYHKAKRGRGYAEYRLVKEAKVND